MKPGLSPHQMIRISNGHGWHVRAPLPETFGLGTGAELSTPFNMYSLSGTLQKIFVLLGSDVNAGMAYTKFWSGPSQPDISVNLKFDAYQSAVNDVILPALGLLIISSPTEVGGDIHIGKFDLTKVLASIINVGGDVINLLDKALGKSGDVVPKTSETTLDKLFKVMKAPKAVSVQFGNIMMLSDLFITSCNVQFSNVLEYTGFPMSATVSLSLAPQSPFGRADIANAFGLPRDKKYPYHAVFADPDD